MKKFNPVTKCSDAAKCPSHASCKLANQPIDFTMGITFQNNSATRRGDADKCDLYSS